VQELVEAKIPVRRLTLVRAIVRQSLNFVTGLCYMIFKSVDLILDGKLNILFARKTYGKTSYYSQNTVSLNIG